MRRNWPYIGLAQGNYKAQHPNSRCPTKFRTRIGCWWRRRSPRRLNYQRRRDRGDRGDGRDRPEPRGSRGARSVDGRDGLAKVLAVLKQSEHRRVESVCQRWRQIRPRASTARVKSLRFRGRHVMFVARRFRNNQEDYYSTQLRFSNVGIGRKEIIILDGTGDDFVISTMHEGSKRFLRMHPGTGVCKPPNHQVLTEDRAQATHFEAVETLFHGQREYHTLPNYYVYFRLKGTQSFLKVHAWEQIGVLPQDLVTHRRNRRPNEGHAFKIHRF